MRSLRSRLILASVLWTAGLLFFMHMFSMLLVRMVPMPRGVHSLLYSIVALTTMGAGLWTAARALDPFRLLRERLLALQRGQGTRVDGEYPSEIQPLVSDLNSLLEDRERAVQRAFATAGDLAHGLKTPLALLAQEAERAGASGCDGLAESIAQQVDRMSRQVSYHLARARAAASGTSGAAPIALGPSVDSIVRTMGKLYTERELFMTVILAADLYVRVQREDLEEVLGNIFDNACKWAHSRLEFRAERNGAFVSLILEDDGPGLPAAQRTTVFERGVRLDEAAPGSGLGLAIVRDLCEIYGGSIRLDDSPEGGLSVRVELPGGFPPVPAA